MCCDDEIMFSVHACNHEWRKTLTKSGMCFIDMCHKCHEQKPYTVIGEIARNRLKEFEKETDESFLVRAKMNRILDDYF
jgi:hypothetical protein